jgi:hypothetical protein
MTDSIKVKVNSQPGVKVNVGTSSRVLINQSSTAVRSIGELIDVDTSGKTDGSLLIYDETQDKFVASTLLEKQTVNGGHF